MAVTRSSVIVLIVLVLAVSGASEWWRQRHADNFGARVAALAGPGDLRMLSSDSCVICVQARRWFGEHGVRFSECSIERDAACAAEFEALRAPGTPVFLVRGQPQVGFNPQRLLAALDA